MQTFSSISRWLAAALAGTFVFAAGCAVETSRTSELASGVSAAKSDDDQKPADTGECTIVVAGDGATCFDDYRWKELVECPPGTVIQDIVVAADCADATSTQAKASCCTPPEEPPLENCSQELAGDSATCIPQGLEKELFACPPGQSFFHVSPAYDCADGASTVVKYECCDLPPEPPAPADEKAP